MLTHRRTFQADKLITIALEDGGVFTVQKALLLQTSDYFKAALNSNFVEGMTDVLSIPGCSTDTFKLLLVWMCRQKLPDFKDLNYDNMIVMVPALTRLWLIGDMLFIAKLQNEAMRGLTMTVPWMSSAVSYGDSIRFAYESTTNPSMLRRVFFSAVVKINQEWGLDAQETNMLAEIPGFFHDFTRLVTRCKVPCKHKDHPDPIFYGGVSLAELLVPEETGSPEQIDNQSETSNDG